MFSSFAAIRNGLVRQNAQNATVINTNRAATALCATSTRMVSTYPVVKEKKPEKPTWEKKRVPNTFVLFKKENYQAIKKELWQQQTSVTNKEIADAISNKWKSLSEEEKKPYVEERDKQQAELRKVRDQHKRLKKPRKYTAYNLYCSSMMSSADKGGASLSLQEVARQWQEAKVNDSEMEHWKKKAEEKNETSENEWKAYLETEEAILAQKEEQDWEQKRSHA